MTRTRLRSRWLVAWDGSRQRLIPNGELVFEGDLVRYVGRRYRGHVDRDLDAGDALIAPGLVNLHVHAGPLAAGRLFDDAVRAGGEALGFLQYAAPRADGAAPPVLEVAAAARLTAAELLRFGVTTAVEYGGETGIAPEAMAEAGLALGLRLVLGRGFRSRDYLTRPDGTIGYRDRADGGAAALRSALAFAEALLERGDPRLGAMLFPLQIDTCTPALLGEAYAAAEALGIALQVHGAQTPFEVATLARETGRTPVAQLEAAGALGPRTLLAHGVFLGAHSWLPGAATDDVGRLANRGAAVVHAPLAMARRGVALESYGRYLRRGVRVAVGTDTYPRDPVAELRWAMYLSRIQDRSAAFPDSWTALASATDVAADLLARPDLGRLAVGARADMVVVDLDRFRTGPVFDPVAAWLHAGVGESVRDVWTGGEIRVRDGRVLGIEETELVAARQRDGEAAWAHTADWEHQRRDADAVAQVVAQRRWNGPDDG